LPVEPAACANLLQWASAPAMPPRSPPLPGPALVRKNVMLLACCACAGAPAATASSATDASMEIRILVVIAQILP
jgi:hypothetical protein